MIPTKGCLVFEKLTPVISASVWFPPILTLGDCTASLPMQLISHVSKMDQSMWDIRRNWTIILSFQWMIQFPLILALSGTCIFLAKAVCSLSLGSDTRQSAEGEILEENKLISDKRLFIFRSQFVSLQLSLSLPGNHHSTSYKGTICSRCYPAFEMWSCCSTALVIFIAILGGR
jgi:hypothetical protein